MLSSSDCESRAAGGAARARARRAASACSALRLGYTEVPGSEELRAAVAERLRARRTRGRAHARRRRGGDLPRLPRAARRPATTRSWRRPATARRSRSPAARAREVSLWRRRYEDGWAHDLDELERLLRRGHAPHLHQQPAQPHRHADAARDASSASSSSPASARRCCSATRSTGASSTTPPTRLPAACDLYERAISLGTVSKAHGLPGLRIGWLACRDPALLERIRELKLYTTICSSAPSELLVALALRHAERAGASATARIVLAQPAARRRVPASAAPSLLEWVRPSAGPIGFPRVAGELDVERLVRGDRRAGRRAAAPGRRLRAAAPRAPRASAARTCRRRSARLDEHLG